MISTNQDNQKYRATIKYYPKIGTPYLLKYVPRAFSGRVAKHKVGMAAITLLAIATGFIVPAAHAANQLFKTDMGSGSFKLTTPVIASDNRGGGQYYEGINPATGTMGPIKILGTNRSVFQMITGQPIKTKITDYVANDIQQVTGPKGNQISALHQIVKDNSPVRNGTGYTQDAFQFQRLGVSADTGDVYYTYWFKFQSNLLDQLNGSYRNVIKLRTN